MKKYSAIAGSDQNYSGDVPNDFPPLESPAAFCGLLPSIVVMSGDELYVPFGTEQELWERWKICEFLTTELKNTIDANIERFFKYATPENCLEFCRIELRKKGFCSDSEIEWIIRHATSGFGWFPRA